MTRVRRFVNRVQSTDASSIIIIAKYWNDFALHKFWWLLQWFFSQIGNGRISALISISFYDTKNLVDLCCVSSATWWPGTNQRLSEFIYILCRVNWCHPALLKGAQIIFCLPRQSFKLRASYICWEITRSDINAHSVLWWTLRYHHTIFRSIFIELTQL